MAERKKNRAVMKCEPGETVAGDASPSRVSPIPRAPTPVSPGSIFFLFCFPPSESLEEAKMNYKFESGVLKHDNSDLRLSQAWEQ